MRVPRISAESEGIVARLKKILHALLNDSVSNAQKQMETARLLVARAHAVLSTTPALVGYASRIPRVLHVFATFMASSLRLLSCMETPASCTTTPSVMSSPTYYHGLTLSPRTSSRMSCRSS